MPPPIQKSLSGRQQQELAQKCYTFLGKRQRRLAYARARANANPSGTMAFAQMATKEAEFDEQIHRLAEIDDKGKNIESGTFLDLSIIQFHSEFIGRGQRRQSVDPIPNVGPAFQNNQFLALQPYAFSN